MHEYSLVEALMRRVEEDIGELPHGGRDLGTEGEQRPHAWHATGKRDVSHTRTVRSRLRSGNNPETLVVGFFEQPPAIASESGHRSCTMLYTSPGRFVPVMSSVSDKWTRHARLAALGLVLLAFSSSLASSPPVQANAPTVLFSPGAGTFVGSETVTLSAQGRAEIHYTLDGSLPTVTSPVYRGPLTLDTSTRLRAFAIAPGASGTSPPSHTPTARPTRRTR